FLVIALFLQVLFRYVIGSPLSWSEEGARFALVWYAMLAAGIAARKGQQFVFRWVAVRIPDTARTWLRQILNGLAIGLLIIILIPSLGYLDVVANQTAPGTHLTMRVAYLGVIVGIAYLLIVY